jgi:hypothetical protein
LNVRQVEPAGIHARSSRSIVVLLRGTIKPSFSMDSRIRIGTAASERFA